LFILSNAYYTFIVLKTDFFAGHNILTHTLVILLMLYFRYWTSKIWKNKCK